MVEILTWSNKPRASMGEMFLSNITKGDKQDLLDNIIQQIKSMKLNK